MGQFVNPRWLSILAWVIAIVIMTLNIYLIVTFFFK
jgi:manganese transport protein